MAGEFFSSSYKQYKNDTSSFTTWLGRAAESCGYKPKSKKKLPGDAPQPPPSAPPAAPAPQKASVPTPRLKGKARKAAKQAQAEVVSVELEDSTPTVQEYGVTTQELLDQIDTVSNSKVKVAMPSGIKKVLERAIDARRRCSDWYETAKRDAAILDSDGHRHFISVLQDAFIKLGTETKAEPKRPRQNAAKPKAKGTTTLENRFNCLEVEDTDDNYELSPAEVALATMPSQKKASSVDVFALEAEKAFDDAFAVFCFFEDMHRAQESIRKMWKDAVSSRTSLVVATAVTHTVVNMIRRAEQELCSRLLPTTPDGNCYQPLAAIMVEATMISKGIDPTQGPGRGVDISPFDDFIFLPVARILLKFMKVAAMERKVHWPAPIPPLSFNYIAQPEKANSPEYKKLRQDDEILTQLLLDVQLPDKCIQGVGKMRKDLQGPPELMNYPQEDIFLRTLRPVWSQAELSVTSVFMAQVMLDIINTCGTRLPRFYGQLKHAGQYVDESMEFTTTPSGAIKTGVVNWPGSSTKNLTTISCFLDSIKVPKMPMMKGIMMDMTTAPKMYTWANTTPEMRKELGSGWDENTRPPPELERSMDRMMQDLRFIQPAPENDFELTHNPLLSGEMIMKLLLEYNEAGIALSNHHMSIFVTAHLYNALRQLKMIDSQWPTMDRVIELHKKAIFADSIPTRTADMADRLSYRLDAYHKQKRNQADVRFNMKVPPAMQPLHLMLEDGASNQARALFQIEQQVQQQAVSQALTSGSKAIQTRKPHTTIEGLIANMEKAISPILDDLSIDYIRLTKKCIVLLDTFRTMWNVEMKAQNLDIQFESVKNGANTNDVGHLAMCLEAFGESKMIREQGQYSYRAGDGGDHAVKGFDTNVDEPWRHGMGLLTASKVFKNFLAKEDSDFCFPVKVPDLATLDAQAPETSDWFSSRAPGKIIRAESAAELEKVLASSTYAIVEFYTDYSRTSSAVRTAFPELMRKHAVPSIFTFVRANSDDMPDVSSKYCKEAGKRVFVCFKEGKQVAVNGQQVVQSNSKAPLKAAVEKLSVLAQKRLAEQETAKGGI